MNRKSILNRRGRRKIQKDFELQLTSMMDMLIILVVFLLKSYSSNSVSFATSSQIQLPGSISPELPVESISVVIEPAQLILDNQKIMDFKIPPNLIVTATNVPGDGGGAATPPNLLTSKNATYEIESPFLADGGRKILPLFDALVKARENAELMMSKAIWKDATGKEIPPKFQGTLVIHADKAVKYELLKKIMYTAGAAQFKVFKLVTAKKEG